MLFTSFGFLGFFAVVFAVYWTLRQHRLRMAWLLLASAVYYMTFNPWLILLILFSASVDYVAAMLIERSKSNTWRRFLLVGSIATNLGLLCYFKYVNFFLDTAYWGFSLFGLNWSRGMVDLVLPLGISFYTFETISYIVDVYTGKTPAVRNPLDYALFILFFPHLLAGPIVRAGHFLPQIERPKIANWNRARLGIEMILSGLFKKAILADHLATVVDPVFARPAEFGSLAIWLAVLGYAVQIYGDFAGYTDIAIGLAHLLDFRLPKNFDHPYLSASPAEFWRRWHISLSTWLRDYLYIPLGGGRAGVLIACRNLLIVMAIGGLWHGAGWTFVLWGLYHGILLAVHRAIRWPAWLGLPAVRPLCILGTFLCVCVGWVLFRATTFTNAGVILSRMVLATPGAVLTANATALVLWALAFVFASGFVAESGVLKSAEKRVPTPILGGALAVVLALVLLLWPENVQSFIYFQF